MSVTLPTDTRTTLAPVAATSVATESYWASNWATGVIWFVSPTLMRSGHGPEDVVVPDPEGHEGRLDLLHHLEFGVAAQEDRLERVVHRRQAAEVAEQGADRVARDADVIQRQRGSRAVGAVGRGGAAHPLLGDVVDERRRAPRHVERGVGEAGAHRHGQQVGVRTLLGAVVDAHRLEAGGDAVAHRHVADERRIHHGGRIQRFSGAAPRQGREAQGQGGSECPDSHTCVSRGQNAKARLAPNRLALKL